MTAPAGWEWNSDRTRLEHVASKFGFDVPRTDEYASAMQEVIAVYLIRAELKAASEK